MHVLNVVAAVAGAILLLELFVVVALAAGISGGLAFGLHWVNGKTGWLFGKINGYLPLVTKYVDRGASYAAKPVILGAGAVARVQGTALAVRADVRQKARARALAVEARNRVAARPIPPAATGGGLDLAIEADATEIQPLPIV